MTDATPPPPHSRLGRHWARARWVVAGVGVAALISAAVVGTASPSVTPPARDLGDCTALVVSAGPISRVAAAWRAAEHRHRPTAADRQGSAPFLFDVDRGTVQPVTGLPTQGDRVVWVLPVGKDAVVVSDRTCKDCREARVYRVQRDTTVATRLGTAQEVVAASDGRAVWMLSDQGPTHCTLRNVGLDGRPRRPARPIPCTTQLVGDLGRAAHHDRLVCRR